MRDAVFGAYGKNEMLYAKSLMDQVPDQSLTVFDKGFFSASLLLQLQTQGTQRHWLIPAKANSVWERLDQTAGDYRVRMKVSAQARQAEPGLPAYWEARAIETTTRHGQKRILLTSMMDTKAYPAKDIVHQYEERWRIETSYRELKQELLGTIQHRNSPGGVLPRALSARFGDWQVEAHPISVISTAAPAT